MGRRLSNHLRGAKLHPSIPFGAKAHMCDLEIFDSYSLLILWAY